MPFWQDGGVPRLTLDVLPGELAVCRLPGEAPSPDWAVGTLVSITRAPGELTVVCDATAVPPSVEKERGWRALAVRGPLDLSLTGVLASLAGPLADAGVPVFVISTYDTDYLLVRDADLERAVAALRAAGHQVAR